MSYSCSDCKEGELVTTIRPIELKEEETVHLLENGQAVIASIGCSNEGCSSHTENGEAEEEAEEKPKRKKRAPATAAQSGQARCTRSDLCSKAYAHTGACNKLRGGEE